MQRAKTSKRKQQRQSSSSAAAAGMECYVCKKKATMAGQMAVTLFGKKVSMPVHFCSKECAAQLSSMDKQMDRQKVCDQCGKKTNKLRFGMCQFGGRIAFDYFYMCSDRCFEQHQQPANEALDRIKNTPAAHKEQPTPSAGGGGGVSTTSVCDVCSKRATQPKRCGSCYRRVYCSKECQLVDWRDLGHKKACKTLAAAHNQATPTNTNTAPSAAQSSPWASMKCDFCSGPAVTGHLKVLTQADGREKYLHIKTCSNESCLTMLKLLGVETEETEELKGYKDTPFVPLTSVPPGGLPPATRCTVCGKKAHMRCIHCLHATYCSEVCQEADWESHREVCDLLKFHHSRVNMTTGHHSNFTDGNLRGDVMIEAAKGGHIVDIRFTSEVTKNVHHVLHPIKTLYRYVKKLEDKGIEELTDTVRQMGLTANHPTTKGLWAATLDKKMTEFETKLRHGNAGFVLDDMSLYGMDVLEYALIVKEKKVPTMGGGAFIPGGLPVFDILLATEASIREATGKGHPHNGCTWEHPHSD
ncbi:unnamed protein product [Vitrella brassicaformis CCMP3155]|uniref:MYND-type domain-containing protein n=2 Tax=Vitrella brassicaformis TaxID=1169539 RepID=A0A0G4FZ46_VITBC|nr:unnamed protein product [Vitrella brassicaformis CCMP3155]|eukprot:CEM20874.1 unnamed protein product [Vitrella brassicaformis CCMP3155]